MGGGSTLPLGALLTPHTRAGLWALAPPLPRRQQPSDDGCTRPMTHNGYKGSRVLTGATCSSRRWWMDACGGATKWKTQNRLVAPRSCDLFWARNRQISRAPQHQGPASELPWASNCSMATLRKKQRADLGYRAGCQMEGGGPSKQPFGAEICAASLILLPGITGTPVGTVEWISWFWQMI